MRDSRKIGCRGEDGAEGVVLIEFGGYLLVALLEAWGFTSAVSWCLELWDVCHGVLYSTLLRLRAGGSVYVLFSFIYLLAIFRDRCWSQYPLRWRL